jgi:hypothetical protein
MDIDITDDGSYFIVGSLGDDANLNPEVHIFQRDSTPQIYYTVDMPGSMISVDIKSDGSYATACGKHIHLNAFGRGGDIVMINTDITGITSDDVGKLAGEAVSLAIHPNPFTHYTDIRWQITDDGHNTRESRTELSIYDASGRLIRDFVQTSVIGHQLSVSWDGRDEHNRMLGCGVYFVQLEAQGTNITKKIVKLD